MGNKVMTTSKYDLFKVNTINRPVERHSKRYQEKERSMLKDGWWETRPLIAYPKGADGKHEISAGHKGYDIAKRHNIAIKWQIDDGRIPIHVREEIPSTWSIKDWMVSHTRANTHKDYRTVWEYHQKTGIPIGLSIKAFLSGKQKSGYQEIIRDGSFRIFDYEHPEILADVIVYCSSLNIPYCKAEGFVLAILHIIYYEIVPINELKRRLKRNKAMLQSRPWAPNYSKLISDAYNSGYTPKFDLETAIRNAMDEDNKRIMAKAREAVARNVAKHNERMVAAGKETP